MNNDGLEILKTYKIIGGNKIAILSNGNGYLIAPNGQTTEWYQGFPYQVGALQFCIKDDGQLSFTGPYNNQYYQDFPVTPELSPSAMRFNGTLINFDNYNQLWHAMGQQLKDTYCILRSQDKIPVHAKNQFKKAFISMGKNKINLNLLLDPNTCQPFLSFFEFAKTILNNTNSVNDCNNLNTIFQFCCLPQEKTSLQNIYNQKNQQLKGNNQGFYQNNFNQLNIYEIIKTYNLGQNKKVSIRNDGRFYYTVNSFSQRFLPSGLKVHDRELWRMNSNNLWQKCKAEYFPSTMLWYGNLIDFDNYNGHLWPSMGNEFAKIYSKWRNYPAKIPDKAKNQFKKAFILMGKNKINLNQYLEPNSCQPFSSFLDFAKLIINNTKDEQSCKNMYTILQSCCLPQEKMSLQNIYNQKIQQLNGNNQGFYQKNQNNFNNQFHQNNQLNHFFNNQMNNNVNNNVIFTKQITHHFFGTLQIQWKRNGSNKALITGLTINGTKSDANLNDINREQSVFLMTKYNQYIDVQLKNNILKIYDINDYDHPLASINLLEQQINQNQNVNNHQNFNANNNFNKGNFIQGALIQNNLLPLDKYKEYFGDDMFQSFLAWYAAKQQNLPNNPNVHDLANVFNLHNKQRCRFLLNKRMDIKNDKILAYYIGYILSLFQTYQSDANTIDRLFCALQSMFPDLRKYVNGNDLFPEVKIVHTLGGVQICEPKPVDEDVKECLKKLSENGVNQLGNEYQVETKKGKTIIRKGSELIFEGTLSEDRKGFEEGTLVIKYDNQGQPDEYYQGQFKGTKMDGNGTYVFAKRFPAQKDHEVYKGQFKDGQLHGNGQYYNASGFYTELTYNNGLPINVKNAKDRGDTDVIVFDFFGFASGAYEDKEHGGRYDSSFFITDDRSYQYKREKIFKLKDEEGMPGLYQQPNEGQQKAMDFIKTHLLIQGVDYYTKLFNEEELRKIQGFDFDKAMREFGNGQLLQQLSQLTSQEAKEKWLCFVIDEIGPDAFNKLYLEDNMNYHFSNIQRNTDKKLKIVLNIHGTPQLGMSFGPKDQGYKEKFELINKVFKRAASLGRDMYVSNNSCYGSQFLDDKQNIFKQIGVGIFANKADFKPIITYSGINESIEEIKKKYGSTDKFLKICELKAEADSWRLTKMYEIKKDAAELFNEEKYPTKSLPKTLKQFFIDKFCHIFQSQKVSVNLTDQKIFHKQTPGGSLCALVLPLRNVLGSDNKNIDFLEKNEEIILKYRKERQFEDHIRDFFDFVKKKLFVGDNLDQLTEEGKKIEAAIEAKNKIVNDIINYEKGVEFISDTKEGVLEKIDNVCKTLEQFQTEKDKEQIDLLKKEISQKFDSNGKLEPNELRKMLSKVDLFNLIKKLENEFVKGKMQEKLDANGMTLEQLDKFGDTKVNEMLGHLSTSIWLTRSFLLGGVLSKEMGVDKILEGFREKCYRLLYKFGDQEINDAAMTELNLELNQELGKIKNEIESKCQRYCEDIGMNNWEGVVEPKLQELKNKILTTDNYYTQQLTPEQIEALKQQQFNFDKKNLVKFLRLLPGKIDASMKKAKDNIVNYCKDIKNNNKQNIKDLLKQLKNDKMQNKHIIYSTNMTGMTPSYMIEMPDGQAKKSNRNLGKMYYEVLNNQIVPLVTNKQEYEKALREFENKLANTEKNGLTDDTPGLEGIKFHDLYDIKQIQNNEIMKFVKEGKRNKNKLMGWIEEEKNYIYEKFPENTKIKEQHDNIYTNQQVISNSQPEYAINGATKVPKNNTKNRNIGTYNPYGPHDAKNNNPTYNQYTQYSQLDNNPLG